MTTLREKERERERELAEEREVSTEENHDIYISKFIY